MEETKKIESFYDLNAWKESHKLAIMIYKITKQFPRDEIFGLTSQIRRATVSISSNIAEGFSRNSHKEKLNFYSIALGSLTETQNQLLISRDVSYIGSNIFKNIWDQTIIVSKLCNGLIKKMRSFNHNT
ncbi:MAG: hypothetical protein A2431_02925 [Candidatus Zambryskibacteria bacterium RIFOXYC1_FULL_39_10]|uniref:Four helix bundle protein n=1 Tax=Candidatus Zambryskibacteria bacterium RIFOXYC1_FULL_39_10 TaxID=1802779 RepID=A0A1G2V017_9BACT|nr:MAG: hypothetical protein A2605_02145 [Candidatus Zambryskibacteria bacterium RIFOXYD1_FULL_39_35]OHB14976.1 MAG: hypothetical protein A2431_02925 [Candidatus Zambryskibacteria bacterium RIFOXYC1_FULL_39_10]